MLNKNTRIHFLIIFFFIHASVFAAKSNLFQKISPRIANYKIQVKLDPEEKSLDGRQILEWTNTSDAAVSELQFHLYMNAFKNSHSTYMQEASPARRKRPVDTWGFIRIDTLLIADGTALTSQIQFIHPDDSNFPDETVIRVPLPAPVAPQDTIKLEFLFYVKLPKIIARTGYAGDFFMVAQWFPKIGVLENGRWNCHQFHLHSEFFADFGTYEVSITVPENFVVGATADSPKTVKNQDNTKTLNFSAFDIHDFAWTASPNFQVFNDTYQSKFDKQIVLNCYLLPGHTHLVGRHIQPVKGALQWAEEWIGEYPYSHLSFMSPPMAGFSAGGMEYPTFFTVGAAGFLPAGIRITELIAVHEFSHNYWYGMVATNEFEEPWLDEGFTSYSEVKAMEAIYGSEANIIDWLGIKLDVRALQKISYLTRPDGDPIVQSAWQFAPGAYGSTVYNKASLMLLTFENLIGEEKMRQIIQTYFEHWKFKHPKTGDFFQIVSEVTGQDWNWYFDQLLYGTGSVDYAVTSLQYAQLDTNEIIVTETTNDSGIFNSVTTDSSVLFHAKFESAILVERLGDIKMPVNILIKFNDGQEVWKNWDGQSKWQRFKFRGPNYVVSAEIDPKKQILLDVNFANNSRTSEFQTAGINRVWLKIVFWIQNALLLVSSLG